MHFTSTDPITLFAEIVTTTGSYFVSFDSAEERDGWIESIRKASVRQMNCLDEEILFIAYYHMPWFKFVCMCVYVCE